MLLFTEFRDRARYSISEPLNSFIMSVINTLASLSWDEIPHNAPSFLFPHYLFGFVSYHTSPYWACPNDLCTQSLCPSSSFFLKFLFQTTAWLLPHLLSVFTQKSISQRPCLSFLKLYPIHTHFLIPVCAVILPLLHTPDPGRKHHRQAPCHSYSGYGLTESVY